LDSGEHRRRELEFADRGGVDAVSDVALVSQPVWPQPGKPLTTPYAPNLVMLPFQPPVTYTQGGFGGGQTLLQLLESGVPAIQVEAATVAADVANAPSDNVTVTVYDKFYNPLGEINDYISLSFQFARNAVGAAQIVMKGVDPLAPAVLACAQTTVPITIETGTQRWSGRVMTADDTFGPIEGTPPNRAVRTVTVTCVDEYAYLDHILCWPNFLLPIEVQFPSEAVYIGPAVTCVKTLVAEQCFRLQSGIYELINSFGSLDFEPLSANWASALLSGGGDLQQMLLTPIVIVPTDPVNDTSPWVSFSGRMDQISTLIDQVVKDTGTNVTMTLWMPGDPQPDVVGPDGLKATLTVPTVVMDATDNLNVTGATGTFLDGIFQDVVDLQNGVLGQTLAPFLNPTNEYAPQGINIAPTVGVNFVQPWVVMTDDPRSGMIASQVKARTPLCTTVVAGGKSPQWLDDLLNILASWAIQAITIAIGITGIPSDLFDGVIDDVIFAFWEARNFERQQALGPYAWAEYFAQTGSSAYTLDSWFAMQNAMWDTRGLYSYQWSFLNGYPYTIGVDVFVGQLASIVNRGLLYTDYINSVVFTDDRTTRLGKVEITVGDLEFVLNPVAKIYRKLVNTEKAMQILALNT